MEPRWKEHYGLKRAGVIDEAQLKTGESEDQERAVQDSRLSKLQLPADEPFIQKIAERKKEVTVYDIQEDPFFEDQRASCKDAFDQLQATLIVPLIYEDKLTGLISLGEKKSGKFYRREDINLLNTLANQGAVAIENARMIEEVIEKERMEEELSIARDLQTSMLPAECPTIKGFEIAAYSVSAREVGGDFYDFIEMGEDKVGMVIGDVTGKSVSGALVMSASRSVFPHAFGGKPECGRNHDSCQPENQKRHQVRHVRGPALCGFRCRRQNTESCAVPARHSPYTGLQRRASQDWWKQKGIRFLLGFWKMSEYQETRLHLAPGDKIVLYTDGIVEAMNDKEEIFGFERLLEIVQGASSMTADSLLKRDFRQSQRICRRSCSA